MNSQQEKFYQFIMDRVKSEKREEVQQMLLDNFKRQEEKTFNDEHKQLFMQAMMECLKEEYREEVMAIMKSFQPKENV